MRKGISERWKSICQAYISVSSFSTHGVSCDSTQMVWWGGCARIKPGKLCPNPLQTGWGKGPAGGMFTTTGLLALFEHTRHISLPYDQSYLKWSIFYKRINPKDETLELIFLKNFIEVYSWFKCCVSFWCTAKWFSYIYNVFFFIFFSIMVYHGILNIVPCAVQ